MCVCAFDIHPFSLTMVQLVKSPVPIVLEGELFANGQELCPGHLTQTCPLCELQEDTYEAQVPTFFEKEVSR